MATRIIDELRSIKQEADDSAIRKAIIDFFDEMEVDDVGKRTELAISLEKIFREMFLMALAGELAREQLISNLITEYSMAIVASGYRPNYAHIERVCEDIVDNTLEGIETPYMTSTGRSIAIAENETNNVANNDELENAKAEGKTEKTWVAFHDNRTRQTHRDVDGTTIPIDDMFEVGNAQLMYPCDEVNGYDNPEEVCNCRCHLIFS